MGIMLLGAGCAAETASTTVTAPKLPAIQPADFGFVADYGAYGKNQLDTFQDTFTKDIISQTRPNPTVELRLSAEDMATLYQDLRAMDILAYPEYLDPSNTGKTGVTASTPTTYRLVLRAGGFEKRIDWVHGEIPRTDQARAFQAWFDKLSRMIMATPEFRGLPPLEGGYS